MNVCMTFCFSVHPLLDPWVVCKNAWMLLCTWVCKYLFSCLLSVLLHVYSEVELLDHMVILCLIVEYTNKPFPIL
jgi:hypothetical protein